MHLNEQDLRFCPLQETQSDNDVREIGGKLQGKWESQLSVVNLCKYEMEVINSYVSTKTSISKINTLVS